MKVSADFILLAVLKSRGLGSLGERLEIPLPNITTHVVSILILYSHIYTFKVPHEAP